MQNCIYNTSKTFEELKKQTPSMIENYIYEQTGLTLSPEILQNFELYSEFLLTENEKYNLTAITATKDIWIKHFADSILGNYFLKSRANLGEIDFFFNTVYQCYRNIVSDDF